MSAAAVEGWLSPPGSSRREAARLAVRQSRLELETANGVEFVDPAGLRPSGRIGNVPRRLALPDGRLFETADNDGVDRLLASQAARGRASWLAAIERFRPRLVLIAMVFVASALAAVRWGLPALADAAAALVPDTVEARIANGTLDALDATVLDPTRLAPQRQREVAALFAALAAASDLPPGRLTLIFRRSEMIGANALALPGGTIIVTDDLLAIAPDDDGLAGVLAHEIGHIEARHGLRQLLRTVGLGAVLILVTGDATDLVEEATVLPALLVQLSYSRAFEREADDRGLALLAAVGRRPDGFIGILERLAGACGTDCEPPAWLSTHPATAERIAHIRATARFE
ncbi:MAG: M48 family metallopeptidase [Dongiaceae bacterium]